MTKEEARVLFQYDHLPENLQVVSKPFFDQAMVICMTVGRHPMRTKALWKLWEAKNLVVATVAQNP